VNQRATVLLNIAISQAGWFGVILAASHGKPVLAGAVAIAGVVAHLALSSRRRTELLVVLAVMAVGATWDSVLAANGVIRYPNGQWSMLLAPYWLFGLWALFATTLNVSMRWLHGRWLAAVLFGGIGGPLSFWAGARLGAAQFPNPVLALGLLAVGWALLMPLLVRITMALDASPSVTRLPAH
jgi:hypothetical protein